jgi:twitching motility protein PilI
MPSRSSISSAAEAERRIPPDSFAHVPTPRVSHREMPTVADDIEAAMGGDALPPWLSPSEALTRFTPGPSRQTSLARAPIRFGFRVGDIGLLVPAGMLSELVEETEVFPVPMAPIWLRGLINLRGSLVPVFDLKAVLGMEGRVGEAPRLLVLGGGGTQAVCVMIDDLPLAVPIAERLPQQPPLPALLGEHSRSVYMWQQGPWVELDLDGLLRAVTDRNLP